MGTPGRGKQAGKGRDERRDARARRRTRRSRCHRAGIDSGEMAIDFLPRRSHQLIAHHQSPRLSSRLVRSVRLPVRPCPIPVIPVHRRPSPRPAFRASARPVLSSCRLVVLSSRSLIVFLSSSRRGLPYSWRRINSSEGRQRRRRRGFLCAVFFSSLSFVMPSGSPRRGRHLIVSVPVVAVSTGPPPYHLIRLISIAPIAQPHHRGRSSSLKQATTSRYPSHHGGFSGSSSHPIPVMKRLARASRHEASRPPSRTIWPRGINKQAGSGEAGKQANTKTGTNEPGRKTGSRGGARTERTQQDNGTETERERTASKAEATRTCGNHEQE